MRLDLHIHTTASDGTWSPEVLIQNLSDNEIGIFSVTDHDSIDNISHTVELAKEAGLRFIPGVEINVLHDNKNIHVLGYGIDTENEELENVLTANRQTALEKNEEIILSLRKKGLPVSLEEYRGYVNQPERGGWKCLNYVMDKGLCNGYRDFFRLFKDRVNPFASINFVSPDQAVTAIKAAGGIPTLAHPGARIYNSDYRTVIDIMLQHKIEGIECFHPENNSETTSYCLKVSRENGLCITGGSDCHGDFVKERSLGKPEIDSDRIELGRLLKM